MSKLFSRIKELFKSKRVDVEREDDRLRISDVKDFLQDMGYDPEEGSRNTLLTFNFNNIYYEVSYEDFRLDIRMYIFDEDPALFEIFRNASYRVSNELAMVKSYVKLNNDGSYFVMLGYNIFISSKREFEKFFPCYFREVKDGYVWFVKYVKEMYENLNYSVSENINKCGGNSESDLPS